jgi:hypothetical protein
LQEVYLRKRRIESRSLQPSYRGHGSVHPQFAEATAAQWKLNNNEWFTYTEVAGEGERRLYSEQIVSK